MRFRMLGSMEEHFERIDMHQMLVRESHGLLEMQQVER
jgi:hypothetical protein